MRISAILAALLLAAPFSGVVAADSLWRDNIEVSGHTRTYSAAAVSAWAIAPRADLLHEHQHSLALPLPGQGDSIALRERVIYRAPGDLTWIGRIQDHGGQVMLTVKNGWLAGKIHAPRALYEITPEAVHGTLLMQLDPGAFPPCDGGLEPAADFRLPERQPTPAAPRPDTTENTAARGEETVQMDLLVVYTEAVRQWAGGTEQVLAFAQAAVDTGNTAFGNSEVDAEFRMVHAEEIDFTSTSECGDDIAALRTHTQVAQLRNAHHADMVGLLVEANYCGCGYVMRNPGPGFQSHAFQVTARQCAVGNLTYAHEHGHNMGMEHNPENGINPVLASYPWSFGHYVSGQFRTVMSYADPCVGGCQRQPYFSNPDVRIWGEPTGVAGERDNARTARLTAPIVRDFRTPPSPPGIAITPPELQLALATGQTAARSLWIANPGGQDLIWSAASLPSSEISPGDCHAPGDLPWLHVSPDTGSVAAGDVAEVIVAMDTGALDTGTHPAQICFSSNDTESPELTVPVLLEVRPVNLYHDRFEHE